MPQYFDTIVSSAESGMKSAIRACQAWQYLIGKASNRQISRYEELRELMGYPTSNPLGGILGCIMSIASRTVCLPHCRRQQRGARRRFYRREARQLPQTPRRCLQLPMVQTGSAHHGRVTSSVPVRIVDRREMEDGRLSFAASQSRGPSGKLRRAQSCGQERMPER